MRTSICAAAMAFTVMIFANANPAFADPAASPLTVCNKLAAPALAAVGYFSSGVSDTENTLSGPFVSRGWWPVQPGECHTFPNPFNARYMFWYGFANGLNDNDTVVLFMRIKPGLHMCVTEYFHGGVVRAFTYEDENASKESCDQTANTLWVTPNKVDTFIQSQVDITAQ